MICISSCIFSDTELLTFQHISDCSYSLPGFLKQNPLRPSVLRKEVFCFGCHCCCLLFPAKMKYVLPSLGNM